MDSLVCCLSDRTEHRLSLFVSTQDASGHVACGSRTATAGLMPAVRRSISHIVASCHRHGLSQTNQSYPCLLGPAQHAAALACSNSRPQQQAQHTAEEAQRQSCDHIIWVQGRSKATDTGTSIAVWRPLLWRAGAGAHNTPGTVAHACSERLLRYCASARAWIHPQTAQFAACRSASASLTASPLQSKCAGQHGTAVLGCTAVLQIPATQHAFSSTLAVTGREQGLCCLQQ